MPNKKEKHEHEDERMAREKKASVASIVMIAIGLFVLAAYSIFLYQFSGYLPSFNFWGYFFGRDGGNVLIPIFSAIFIILGIFIIVLERIGDGE